MRFTNYLEYTKYRLGTRSCTEAGESDLGHDATLVADGDLLTGTNTLDAKPFLLELLSMVVDEKASGMYDQTSLDRRRLVKYPARRTIFEQTTGR